MLKPTYESTVSSKNDDVLQSFYDLNDGMAEYVQHPIRMIFVTMLPFRLGYWLGSFFVDSMAKEKNWRPETRYVH